MAGSAGFGAGRLGSRLLRGLRRGVRPPRLWCEVAVTLLWAAVAVGETLGATPPWWVPVPLALGWLAVLLSVCDVLARRLPDALTLPAYPGCAALLAFAACWRPELVPRALVGAVVFAGCYACVSVVAPGNLGAGDVKLAGSLGALIGAVSPVAVPLVVVVAALLTLAVAAVLRRGVVPHGPSMLLPGWVVTAFPFFGAEPAPWWGPIAPP